MGCLNSKPAEEIEDQKNEERHAHRESEESLDIKELTGSKKDNEVKTTPKNVNVPEIANSGSTEVKPAQKEEDVKIEEHCEPKSDSKEKEEKPALKKEKSMKKEESKPKDEPKPKDDSKKKEDSHHHHKHHKNDESKDKKKSEPKKTEEEEKPKEEKEKEKEKVEREEDKEKPKTDDKKEDTTTSNNKENTNQIKSPNKMGLPPRPRMGSTSSVEGKIPTQLSLTDINVAMSSSGAGSVATANESPMRGPPPRLSNTNTRRKSTIRVRSSSDEPIEIPIIPSFKSTLLAANTFVEAKPEETVKIENQCIYRDFDMYYKLGKELGGGNFGRVYEAYDTTSNYKVAVKKVTINKSMYPLIKREVDITASLSHPNIQKCFGVFADQNYLYIVNEIILGGELLAEINRIKIFPMERVKLIFITLGKAIYYCHKQKVIHRDIKPENILYAIPEDDKSLKLIDFGFAKAMDEEKSHGICGTPEYIAPEIISSKPYDEKADIWSLGVIAFLLITGRLPFPPNRNPNVLFSYIKSGNYSLKDPIWDTDMYAKRFVQKCLQVDPAHRFGALELMQSPFLTSHPEYIELTKYDLPKRNDLRASYISKVKDTNLTPGSVEELYDFEKIIGFGTVGCVYKAKHKKINDPIVAAKAIKVIRRDLVQRSYNSLYDDIGVPLSFKHINLVTVIQIEETNDYVYVVESLLSRSNDLITCLSKRKTYYQSDVQYIIYYIVQALCSSECLSSAHKNIKPDNIFLTNPEDITSIVLTGYGLGLDYFLKQDKDFLVKEEDTERNKLEEKFFIKDFLPPEYFQHGRLTKQSDSWSVGILTYFLVTAALPFSYGRNSADTVKFIYNGLTEDYFKDDYFQSISSECKDFILSLTQADPYLRKPLFDVAQHPFLTSTIEDVDLSSLIPLFKKFSEERKEIRKQRNKYQEAEYFNI